MHKHFWVFFVCLSFWVFCATFHSHRPQPSCNADKIEFITNFEVNPEHLTAIIQKQGSSHFFEKKRIEDYAKIVPKHNPLLNKIKFIRKLKKKLRITSHPPRKIHLDPSIHKILFFNYPEHYLELTDFRKIDPKKLVLFMWEPPCVLFRMHTPKVLDLFDKVYTWDDHLVDNKKFFKFYYPELKPLLPNLPSFEKRKFCCLVNANKTSHHPDELYSERAKIIHFFEAHHPKDFEFYGFDWDKLKHPCYQGTLSDKFQAIQHYKFLICYENIANIQGYISEKIFDSFAAGCIPIYWGASNVTDFIPKDCFIDKRDFDSLEDLYLFMKHMTQEDYENYLERIRSFITSEEAQKFSQKHFEKLLYEASL